jgi:sugar phosphate permease
MDTHSAPVTSTGLYHGWKVLIALFLAGFFVYGGGLYCFVLFVTPLTAEFGWSRASTGGIVSAFWLSFPLLLVGGYAIRRFGVTRMLAFGIGIEAICVILLATVSALPQMYLLRGAMGFGKILFAASIPVTCARWFSRHFGLSLGIAWAGWHIGGMVLAPVTSMIIAHSGWRMACVSLGIALLTLALLPILWVQRIDSPASLGLGLDGDPLDAPSNAIAQPTKANAPNLAATGTLPDLLGSPTFWLIALATLFFYTTYGGVLAHEGAIVEAAGYSATASSWVLSLTTGFAAFGSAISGWLLDRWSLSRVGVLMHLLLIAGTSAMFILMGAPSLSALAIYGVSFGLMIGGSDVFFVAFVRDRFPHVGVGFQYSTWYFVELGTLLVAPVIAGHIYDVFGNYRTTLGILIICATAALAVSALALRTKRPIIAA